MLAGEARGWQRVGDDARVPGALLAPSPQR